MFEDRTIASAAHSALGKRLEAFSVPSALKLNLTCDVNKMMSGYALPPRFILLITFVALCFALFGHLNVLELRGEEPRRAIVAIEMNLSGDYIVPKINGWNYYNKPPAFNWLLALSFKCFGTYDAWVVRLPGLISFLLTGLALYLFVKKHWTKEIALLSSLFFLTAGDLLMYGTQLSGEIDLFFTLVICLQVMSLYHFFKQGSWLLMYIISYALTAVAVLTKGPPAILFQGITLIMLLWQQKKLHELFRWQHAAGLFVLLCITGTYFLAYARQTDLTPYLVNLIKETSQKSGLENHSSRLITSMLTYPLLFIQWLLPWSALGIFLWSKKTLNEIRHHDFLAFSALVILGNIPPYWFTAYPKSRYIYMLLPFAAILLAYAWSTRRLEWPKTDKVVQYIFSTVIIAVPVIALILPFIKFTAPIDHAIVKGAFVAFAGIGVAWYAFHRPSHKIYALVISLVLIRILLNYFYLPVIREKSNALRNQYHVGQMLAKTGNMPITLSGKPYRQENQLHLGPLQFVDTEIVTAPLLSYMLPYFYTTTTGKILQYSPTMTPGQWYLVYEKDLEDTVVNQSYRFEEPWTKDTMTLIFATKNYVFSR